MANAHAPQGDKYYIPHGSPWPIFGSVTMFTVMVGAVSTMEGLSFGPGLLTAGFVLLACLFVGWFHSVIGENQAGMYNLAVDRSFRMGMMWFIFSEVMFFAAFFGALFYARQLSVPWLSGEGVKGAIGHLFLFKDYAGGWPTNGPAALGPRGDGTYEIIPALGLPAVNTLILLTSGVTLTIAHHALQAGKRGVLKVFLAITFLLGFLFIGLQAEEYHHAYTELGLQLSTGVYGSTFFMLTGFHGFHVTVGTLMLIVILGRSIAGHFTPEHHFGFEGVAWYWHFVDVVWLLLFSLLYLI